MLFNFRVYFIAFAIISLPALVAAENWLDFHTERWSRNSTKTGKKLFFSNRYYYDAHSLVMAASGDITLWVKEISDNDRHYVSKGAPQKETVYRKIHLWCKLKRYEIIQADNGEDGANELISEVIRAGSYYEKLFNAVCNSSSQ